jgi:hypothetical protein
VENVVFPFRSFELISPDTHREMDEGFLHCCMDNLQPKELTERAETGLDSPTIPRGE